MSNDRNAPFFDLGYARALSRRLRSAPPTSQERAPERPSFSRFARTRTAPAPRFDAAALGASLRGVEGAWGASPWHALLDGATSAAQGAGAFAMDPQGLVIATRGEVDEALAERLGGRLMLTLDQAAKLGEHAGVVCLEIDGRWLTGLRCRSKSDEEITLGVLASEPIGREARAAIVELIGTIGA